MIYFIQAATGPIKIGYSTTPAGRLIELQTAHYEKLFLLGTVKGDETTEQQLHRRFDEYRIRGEWFAPAPELQQFISTYATKKTGAAAVAIDPDLPSSVNDSVLDGELVLPHGLTRDDLQAIARAIIAEGANFSRPSLCQKRRIVSQQQYHTLRRRMIGAGLLAEVKGNRTVLTKRGQALMRQVNGGAE